MTLARAQGFFVDEMNLWPLDLSRAQEAFITSSVRGLMPISRSDGQVIGAGRPGPVTLRMLAAYEALLQQP